MSKAAVSVIIPVYNLAEYLSKCIESVLAQTYTDFEIIAVDDGSSDNSADILKKYAEEDKRVKPVFKSNGGVSSARNAGLDRAEGEYVFFLDGDDWIEEYTLERLMCFSDEFDVVEGSVTENFDDGSEKIPDYTARLNKELVSRDEVLSYYFTAQDQNYCVNKLYKKSVIDGIRFNEKFAVAEDSEFVYNVFKRTDRIKLTEYITYHYFIRSDSCMHCDVSEKNFAVLELRERQYKEVENNKQLFKKFMYRYSNDILYLIHRILGDKSGKFKDRIPELRKKLLKEKKYIFTVSDISLRFKAGVLLIWLFPSLFYRLYGKYKEGMA